MKVLYQANDGTIFQTERGCLEYEENFNGAKIEDAIYVIKAWEHNNYIFKENPLKEILKNDYIFKEGDCIYIPNEETRKKLIAHTKFKYTGIKVGINYYEYDCDGVIYWSAGLVEELVEEKNELERRIEDLERATLVINEAINRRRKENPNYGIVKIDTLAQREKIVFEAINDIIFEGEDEE